MEETDDARQLLDRNLGVNTGWVLEIGASGIKHGGELALTRDDGFQPICRGREGAAHDDENAVRHAARISVRVLFPGADLFDIQQRRTDVTENKVPVRIGRQSREFLFGLVQRFGLSIDARLRVIF